MASKQNAQAFALLSIYETLYKQRYFSAPRYNKFKEKWAMQDVVDSVGIDRANELLVYYFKVDKPGHPLQWFFYNFDRLDEMLMASEDDARYRERVRERTKKMVEDNANEY